MSTSPKAPRVQCGGQSLVSHRWMYPTAAAAPTARSNAPASAGHTRAHSSAVLSPLVKSSKAGEPLGDGLAARDTAVMTER